MNVNAPEFILSAWPARAEATVSFEELLLRNERLVLNTALRLLGNLADAQDASQEVFLRLYRSLRKLRRGEEVRPWLYRVTVNVCHDLGRRRRRLPLELPEGIEPVSGAADPAAASEANQRERWVTAAIARLPERERAALVLREIEGLTTKEVAAALGSCEATVRSQVYAARVRLKKMLERWEKRT